MHEGKHCETSLINTLNNHGEKCSPCGMPEETSIGMKR